ncbi:hypothetical protein AB3N59_13205 [Leptospira sp. WS92.C1]
MDPKKFKIFLELQLFRESLDYLEILENENNKVIFEAQRKEIEKYSAYIEYSSVKKYIEKSTPNLSFHPIHTIQNRSKTSNKIFEILFPIKKSFAFTWGWGLGFAVLIFVLFVSNFLKKKETDTTVDPKIHLVQGDCSSKESAKGIWEIERQKTKCELHYASAYGATSIFVSPNTSAIIKTEGLFESANLIVEIKEGKVYLKEKLSKQLGTRFQIGSWGIQLRGTTIFLESRNSKTYFTLIEGSLEASYLHSDGKRQSKDQLSVPGETIKLEATNPQIQKITLSKDQLNRFHLELENWKNQKNHEMILSQSSFFKKKQKAAVRNDWNWILRLKNGRIIKGKIRTESNKIIVSNRSGEEIFDEEEVLSVSK